MPLLINLLFVKFNNRAAAVTAVIMVCWIPPDIHGPHKYGRVQNLTIYNIQYIP